MFPMKRSAEFSAISSNIHPEIALSSQKYHKNSRFFEKSCFSAGKDPDRGTQGEKTHRVFQPAGETGKTMNSAAPAYCGLLRPITAYSAYSAYSPAPAGNIGRVFSLCVFLLLATCDLKLETSCVFSPTSARNRHWRRACARNASGSGNPSAAADRGGAVP